MVNAKLNVKTVTELVALSKAKAGTLSYSSAAPGRRCSIEKLKRETGADLV